MDLIEIMLFGSAAVIAIITSVLHLMGWLPGRYKRTIQGIQTTTGEVLAVKVRDGFMEAVKALAPSPEAAQAQQDAFLVKLHDTLKDGVSEGTRPILEGLDATAKGMAASGADVLGALNASGQQIAQGFDALVGALSRVGGQEMQVKSVATRSLNAQAKVGAKSILAQMGQQVGGAIGGDAGSLVGAFAASAIDDKTAEEIATFIMANPQAYQNIANIANRIRSHVVNTPGAQGAVMQHAESKSIYGW